MVGAPAAGQQDVTAATSGSGGAGKQEVWAVVENSGRPARDVADVVGNSAQLAGGYNPAADPGVRADESTSRRQVRILATLSIVVDIVVVHVVPLRTYVDPSNKATYL